MLVTHHERQLVLTNYERPLYAGSEINTIGAINLIIALSHFSDALRSNSVDTNSNSVKNAVYCIETEVGRQLVASTIPLNDLHNRVLQRMKKPENQINDHLEEVSIIATTGIPTSVKLIASLMTTKKFPDTQTFLDENPELNRLGRYGAATVENVSQELDEFRIGVKSLLCNDVRINLKEVRQGVIGPKK